MGHKLRDDPAVRGCSLSLTAHIDDATEPQLLSCDADLASAVAAAKASGRDRLLLRAEFGPLTAARRALFAGAAPEAARAASLLPFALGAAAAAAVGAVYLARRR